MLRSDCASTPWLGHCFGNRGLQRPIGCGVNFQIGVPDLDPILCALDDASWPLFMPPESKWYRVSDSKEAAVRQFLVTDPDGYLVRFQTSLGRRTVTV